MPSRISFLISVRASPSDLSISTEYKSLLSLLQELLDITYFSCILSCSDSQSTCSPFTHLRDLGRGCCASIRWCKRVAPLRIVVVEYIIILIIIIVVLLDFAQLQFCQTVHLESLLFFKPLIFPRKVMGRQFDLFCCWLVFLWPAG